MSDLRQEISSNSLVIQALQESIKKLSVQFNQSHSVLRDDIQELKNAKGPLQPAQPLANTPSTTMVSSVDMLCPSDEFKCSDEKLCIKKEKVCNNVFDCHDRSDEKDCHKNKSGKNTFLALSWLSSLPGS